MLFETRRGVESNGSRKACVWALWFSEPAKKALGLIAHAMINLTSADSVVKVQAEEINGDVQIIVDGLEIPYTRKAINDAGLNFDDLNNALSAHGLPAYRFESQMLLDYAVDYYESSLLLSEYMFFKPPHLFSLGHSYELGMKAVVVLSNKIRLSSLIHKPGHDLVELRKMVIGIVGCDLLKANEANITSFNSLYSGTIGASKFFVRYPDRSHIYGKWPAHTAESVTDVTNESDRIIEWLYSRFKEFCWTTRQRPNKSMYRSRPQ